MPNLGETIRVPPQNLDAEQALLGSLCLDASMVDEVSPIVAASAGFWSHGGHRLIYETIVAVRATGRPMDMVILRDELTRRGLLERVGGVEYLVEIVESVPSAANAAHYAELVADAAARRSLIMAGQATVEAAYEGADDVVDQIAAGQKRIADIAAGHIRDAPVSLGSQLQVVFADLTATGKDRGALSTGLAELDKMIGGLHKGNLIIVAGRPSMGKSALALHVADHLAREWRKPALFVSLEMSTESLIHRLLCMRAGADSRDLRRGNISGKLAQDLEIAVAALAESRLWVAQVPGASTDEIRAKVRRLHDTEKIEAVFVDYLQLVTLAGEHRRRAGNREQEIATMTRQCQVLARETELPIILLSQINREAESRADHRPQLSDLRESGAIEQDADLVLLLFRPEYYGNVGRQSECEIIVAKNRNGPTGKVAVWFEARTTRFGNLAEGRPAEEPPPIDYTEKMVDDDTPF